MISDKLASVVIFTDEWDKTLGLYPWDVEGVLTFTVICVVLQFPTRIYILTS